MILGITAGGVIVPPSIDPFFADVISLCHFDGANGSTTYTDQIAGRTWTNGPAGAALSTTTPKWGAAALKFPGSANNQVDSDAGGDWAFGTADFTIEFWFRIASVTDPLMLWDQRGGGSGPRVTYFLQGGTLLLYVAAGPGVLITSPSNPIIANTWQHHALSRVSGNTRMFLDGVQQGSTSSTAVNYTAGRVRLGTNGDTGGGFGTHAGAYDDIRATLAGRYTANFTPPADAFPNS